MIWIILYLVIAFCLQYVLRKNEVSRAFFRRLNDAYLNRWGFAPGPEPCWELAPDEDEEFWRVRWSEQDASGQWMYVRHFPKKWLAEIEVRRLNRDGKRPHEWPNWKYAPSQTRRRTYLCWTSWAGTSKGRVTMWDKNLFDRWGLRVAIHKFVNPDADTCFHTHPANAIRIILWGGYREEVKQPCYESSHILITKSWRMGNIGLVRPADKHRIHEVFTVPTYTLWLRGRKTAEITIEGDC